MHFIQLSQEEKNTYIPDIAGKEATANNIRMDGIPNLFQLSNMVTFNLKKKLRVLFIFH